MPYIHCDYSTSQLSEVQLQRLVQLLLKVSGQAFGYSELEAKDLVSVFTSASGKHDHSVASAEVEVRAKIAEFDDSRKSRNEIRAEKMEMYQNALSDFIKAENLSAGIVFTITFEDWAVAFLPAA